MILVFEHKSWHEWKGWLGGTYGIHSMDQRNVPDMNGEDSALLRGGGWMDWCGAVFIA